MQYTSLNFISAASFTDEQLSDWKIHVNDRKYGKFSTVVYKFNFI